MILNRLKVDLEEREEPFLNVALHVDYAWLMLADHKLKFLK